MDLADLTTLRLGGPARSVLEVRTEAELVDAVRVVDEAGDPLLVVGGGSNLVVSDDGFDGTVVRVMTRGIAVDADACSGASITVQAGEPWDDVVARAVAEGWVGVEALSGIPGSTGATPVQNVGAYGQDVGQTVVTVRVFDRYERKVRSVHHSACDFSYRNSLFKKAAPRYVVLTVTFQLRLGDLGAPVAYAELARALGVEVGERAPLADVRAAVLALRGGKGMVLDAADHDTWSAGSFFTNPVLEAGAAERLPEGAPRFVQPDGTVKSSAAWLIQHAGFERGHGDGPARLSSKHTLALTNRGSATTEDLLHLAREIRDGVQERFGVELVPEPVLVGVSL
ncbi:UDP-N-acetylenolpyruvoylglucosamine reductase [Aeromicrobium sp. Root495]|uniref:UDP-N-acetylmuramate dehydrogenase n=1 Tax=Aeromicrobium sp. Root495 TaxID=1736550 RepID=UPI0006F97ED7|nr:UDP-N-acetylmuramate dehydrogenase [Aeromicrobium sp. Root495]KQY60148.1 UDP-N-acetylenolpyruvoylglucosamine reductase [Aeromicrobium sp. Root495]